MIFCLTSLALGNRYWIGPSSLTFLCSKISFSQDFRNLRSKRWCLWQQCCLKGINGAVNNLLRETLHCIVSIPSVSGMSVSTCRPSWCLVPHVPVLLEGTACAVFLASAHHAGLVGVRDACAWTTAGKGGGGGQLCSWPVSKQNICFPRGRGPVREESGRGNMWSPLNCPALTARCCGGSICDQQLNSLTRLCWSSPVEWVVLFVTEAASGTASMMLCGSSIFHHCSQHQGGLQLNTGLLWEEFLLLTALRKRQLAALQLNYFWHLMWHMKSHLHFILN